MLLFRRYGSGLRRLCWHRLVLIIAGGLMMAGAGCQMTPSRPDLDARIYAGEDIAATPQQVRIRMRALVEPLSGALIEAADHIGAATTNRTVRREALLWKIEGVPALREALFRPNPFSAIMDAWVLAWQMADYFESGPGREAFGDATPVAITTCQYLENQIETVTASLMISGDVSDAREFAREWAKTHPIERSIGSRESTLSRVNEIQLKETFSTQEVAGNMVVTMDDLTRRLDVYSVQLFDQSRWQAELFAMDQAAEYHLEKAMPMAESVVQSTAEAVETLKRLEPLVADALITAKSAPELVSRERTAAIDAAHQEISRTIEFAQAELVAVQEYVTVEREAALTELHQTLVEQRELLTADMERIIRNSVDHVMISVAQLTGVVLIVGFVGVVGLLFIIRKLFTGRQMTG